MSMGRPPDYQWRPLGLDIDPVPGDPTRIGQEISHLAAVAREVSDQVAALRQIGGASDLQGKYADKVRSKAKEVADDLDKVVGRYQKVSSALSSYLPDLEHAQAMSLQALSQAEGPNQQLTTLQGQTVPSGSNLTTQQQQQITTHQTALKQATDGLNAAKALLTKATTLRDNSASYHAGKIRSAINDAMKDSWWDGVKDWVDKNAGWIKDLCTLLEVIATILAIIALCCTGVGILVIIGAAVTALALMGRILLAMAGDGSWFDVAMDVIALASFGAGTVLTKMLGTVTKGAQAAARTEYMVQTIANMAGRINSVRDIMSNEAADQVLGKFFSYLITRAPTMVPDAGDATTVLERLSYGGDENIVVNARNLAAIAGKFPSTAAFAGQGMDLVNVLRANFALTNVVTLGPQAVGGIEIDSGSGTPIFNTTEWVGAHLTSPDVSVIHDAFMKTFEDGTTVDGGMTTGQVNAVATGVLTTIAPPVGVGFGLATGTW